MEDAKRERKIQVVVNDYEEERIRLAARADRRSMSDFLRVAAEERAKRVLSTSKAA